MAITHSALPTMKKYGLPLIALLLSLALACPAKAAAPGATAPVFLVATPGLVDPIFQKSVVLMLPPAGIPLIVGLIINKPSSIRLSDLFPHDSAMKDRSDRAFLGGPVDIKSPALAFRAVHGTAKSLRVFDDVYVDLHEQEVFDVLKRPNSPHDLRLYLGRAQWAPEQLRNEMMEDSWYILPADPATVFASNPAEVWAKLVEHAQLRQVQAIIDGMPPAQALSADGLPAASLPSIGTLLIR